MSEKAISDNSKGIKKPEKRVRGIRKKAEGVGSPPRHPEEINASL